MARQSAEGRINEVTDKARILSLLNFAGIAGLHRMYLGKPWSGLLWFITMGFGGIGTFFDFVRMRKLAREKVEGEILDLPYEERYSISEHDPSVSLPAETLEHAVLRIAQRDSGIITAGILSLETSCTLAQAKEQLDFMLSSGFCEVRVKRDGQPVYAFGDFLSPELNAELM